LIGSTGLLLCMFGALLLYFLISSINVPFDLFTFSFLLWNFTVGGLVCVFWHAPPIMNQGYLIVVSALLAIFFTRLPEWTTWAILVAIAIYGSFTRSLAHQRGTDTTPATTTRPLCCTVSRWPAASVGRDGSSTPGADSSAALQWQRSVRHGQRNALVLQRQQR